MGETPGKWTAKLQINGKAAGDFVFSIQGEGGTSPTNASPVIAGCSQMIITNSRDSSQNRVISIDQVSRITKRLPQEFGSGGPTSTDIAAFVIEYVTGKQEIILLSNMGEIRFGCNLISR